MIDFPGQQKYGGFKRAHIVGIDESSVAFARRMHRYSDQVSVFLPLRDINECHTATLHGCHSHSGLQSILKVERYEPSPAPFRSRGTAFASRNWIVARNNR